MCASRRSAVWPQMVAISLIGLGVASCSGNSGRFRTFSAPTALSRSEVTGSIPQSARSASKAIRCRIWPAMPGTGLSGGGRGMGSYQPGNSDVTGSLPPGATAAELGPGKAARRSRLRRARSSRRYRGAMACLSPPSWKQTASRNPATVRPGEHLVIPRRRGLGSAAFAAPQTRIATTARHGAVRRAGRSAANRAHAGRERPRRGAGRDAAQHRAPLRQAGYGARQGQQHSAQHDGEGRRAHHHSGTRGQAVATAAPPIAPRGCRRPASENTVGSIASANLPTARGLPRRLRPTGEETAIKAAEPAGSLPSFRWPVRGRVIAGFGPKPNGLQNDGINLAVPEGTPVKAAEDGVVAYAGQRA